MKCNGGADKDPHCYGLAARLELLWYCTEKMKMIVSGGDSGGGETESIKWQPSALKKMKINFWPPQNSKLPCPLK